jgi:GUN4-like
VHNTNDIFKNIPNASKNDNKITITSKDYSKLKLLLKNKNWKEADLKTRYILLKASTTKEVITPKTVNITEISCKDINLIDEVWSNYSEGIFGLKVQSRIWAVSGNNYLVFSDRVGWLNNGSWSKQQNSSTLSKIGSFPRASWWGIMNTTDGAETIFDRIKSCEKE